MSKKRRIIIVIAVVIAALLIGTGLFVFQKFLDHESNQSERIRTLEARISLLEAKDKISEIEVDEIWSRGVQLFSYWQ